MQPPCLPSHPTSQATQLPSQPSTSSLRGQLPVSQWGHKLQGQGAPGRPAHSGQKQAAGGASAVGASAPLTSPSLKVDAPLQPVTKSQLQKPAACAAGSAPAAARPAMGRTRAGSACCTQVPVGALGTLMSLLSGAAQPAFFCC